MRSRAVRRLVAVVTAVLAIAGVAAPAYAATGPDVSSWQHNKGSIDWTQVKAAGNSFAFVKATEGTTYTNPYFAGDWSDIATAGMYRSAYHYARPATPVGTSATAQARYFVAATGTMHGPQDLPPALDLEESGGLSPSDLLQWAQTWLSEVQRLTGWKPLVYSYPNFWANSMGGTTALSGYPLWLASYTSASNVQMIGGWSTQTFWQYTSTATVPGITGQVDMNKYCCSDANLTALAGGGSPAASNPFGYVDSVTPSAGQVQVRGWAIDPDTTDPLTVHVYVDGVLVTPITADGASPDVQAQYPGFGANHRFNATVPIPVGGDHQVCLYAINVGYGTGNTQIGCQTATLPPTPPGPSSGLATQFVGATSAIVAWVPPAVDGGAPVTTYTVTASPLTGAAPVTVTSDTATATLEGLSPGVAYTVTVTAANSAGPGPVSDPLTVTPQAPGSTATACQSSATPSTAQPHFVDIGNDAHAQDVDCLAAYRIVNGVTADRYGPVSAVTREQVASFIARTLVTAGVTLPTPTSGPFTDLAAGDVHAPDVNALAALGILNGVTADRFAGGWPVTRAQMASMLARAFKVASAVALPDGAAMPFTDVTSDDVHRDDIGAVAAAGIALGRTSTEFDPKEPVRRDAMASFLARTLDLLARVKPLTVRS